MMVLRLQIAAAVMAASLVIPAGNAGATLVINRSARPMPQRQVRTPALTPAGNWRATRIGTHTIYGTIAAMRGSVLDIHTRFGRVRTVDASAAVARGDFSAPLFVGKLVSVDGELQNGTFVAAHVFRLDNLNALPGDH